MTAAVGALARLGAHLGLALVIGLTVFLALAGASADPLVSHWRRRCGMLPAAAAALFLAAVALALPVQAAATLEQPIRALLGQPALLREFAAGTQYGQVWALRMAAGAAMLAIAVIPVRSGLAAARAAAVLLAAAAAAAAGAWSGHAAGSEAPYLLPVQVAHVLAVTVWVGALPAWIALVRGIAAAPDAGRCAYAAAALRRFSRLAAACVALIIATGATLAWSYIASQGDLLGTLYGLLVCAKVAVLAAALAVANRVRGGYLAGLGDPAQAGLLYRRAGTLVAAEFTLALVVLALASTLGQTTPANHAQPYWWLPFRISAAATWPIWLLPSGPYAIGAAAALALAAGVWLARGGRAKPLRTRLAVGAGALAGIGGLLVWQLSVPAFPDTYRRSEVAYLTVSIAHGQASYEAHCVMCHGGGGLGDGAAGRPLPRPPANLSQPHTALHTAGDMYWWMGHGIPRSEMPGFADVLTEEDRWDLVNFLRAFSQGFQARILSPKMVPYRPWLGAPDFYYESADGTPRQLKDFRGVSAVLLVFPGGDARLRRLAQSAASAGWPQFAVIVVGQEASTETPPYTVVTRGAGEIRGSYDLLSRTVANRGDPQRIDIPRDGMAFLIDRFGYIRARWIPEEEADGWSDPAGLREQVAALNREPQILPPPDEHVH
ncbi:MAG: CopD family protein [Nevskia sp.]|nr:CopD family protein [Nevskia sp.]